MTMIWSCQGGSEDEFNQCWSDGTLTETNIADGKLQFGMGDFFLHFVAILPPTNRRSPLAQGYVIGRLEQLLCFVCPKMPVLSLIHSHV